MDVRTQILIAVAALIGLWIMVAVAALWLLEICDRRRAHRAREGYPFGYPRGRS